MHYLRKTILPFLLVFFVVAVGSQNVLGAQPDYLTHEEPVPESVKEMEGPLAEGLTEEEEEPRRVIAPSLKEKLAELPPFWRDTSATLNLRTYYFDSTSGETKNQALALGGSFSYESGWWQELLQVGATVFTSQRLYGPKDRDGTLLLRPDQQGFTVLGEAFVAVNLFDHAMLRFYRQSFNLPYVNRQDNRMVPNTFEAYSLGNRTNPHVNYIVSHLTEMKTRNSPNFVSMSEAAGLAGTDEDLTMFGARYTLNDKFNIGAINFYSWEFMNIFYTETNSTWDLTDGLAIRFSGQYTDQQSVGDELGGDFNTWVYGLKAALSFKGAILSFAFTSTDDDSGIRSPYGSYPGYLSLIVKDFNRAGEDAWLVGLSSDFSTFGLSGLSAFVNYAEGDTPDSGVAASPDERELDITVDYRFEQSWLKGLWLRVRAAFVDQDGENAKNVDQYRLILNYDLPIL